MVSEKDQEKLAALLAHEMAEPGSTGCRKIDFVDQLWEITRQGLYRKDNNR